MQIYIHRDGEQFGPYTVDQAKDYLAAGNLHANDLAWYEGAADWIPLNQIDGIAPAAPPPQLAFIPPRRTDVPSMPAGMPTMPAHISDQSFANNNLVAPNQTIPGVSPGGVQQAVRGPSPSVDGIKQARRSIAVRNIGFGALWFFGGSAVTFFSYEEAATSPGGGHYFLAWGAIIFGGIQMVKGIIQYLQA